MGSSGEHAPSRPRSPRSSGARRLLLVGVNHRTAPIALREVVSRRATYPRLRRAAGRAVPWEDLILLTTCNRIEVYVLTEDAGESIQAVAAALEVPASDPSLYVLKDAEAAAHLFRVASGFDSLAQGEGQITGQVRRAPALRPGSRRRPTDLASLFERAAHLASRLHETAGLSVQGTSASHAAIRFIESSVPVARPKVALLGSGKMARIATEALRGRARVSILTRNAATGKRLARTSGAQAAGLRTLESSLAHADVLIAATASKKPLVTERMVRDGLARRRGRPLWLIDLGFPRNVSPACATLAGVTLLDIDGLAPWSAKPLAPAALARVETRIHEEADRFLQTLQPEVQVDVATFRKAVEELRREEVEGALARLPHLSEADRGVVDKLASRLLNRVLHEPTERLRTLPDGLREQLLSRFMADLRDADGGSR